MKNIDSNTSIHSDPRKAMSTLIVENAKLKKEIALLENKIADLECMLMCKQHQYSEVIKHAN